MELRPRPLCRNLPGRAGQRSRVSTRGVPGQRGRGLGSGATPHSEASLHSAASRHSETSLPSGLSGPRGVRRAATMRHAARGLPAKPVRRARPSASRGRSDASARALPRGPAPIRVRVCRAVSSHRARIGRRSDRTGDLLRAVTGQPGPGVTGPGVTERGVTGRGASGPGASGPGATERGVTGRGASGQRGLREPRVAASLRVSLTPPARLAVPAFPASRAFPKTPSRRTGHAARHPAQRPASVSTASSTRRATGLGRRLPRTGLRRRESSSRGS
jgi:hypothetical protein